MDVRTILDIKPTDENLLELYCVTRQKLGYAVLPCLDGSWFNQTIVPDPSQLAVFITKNRCKLIPKQKSKEFINLILKRRKQVQLGKVTSLIVAMIFSLASFSHEALALIAYTLVVLIIIPCSLAVSVQTFKANYCASDFPKLKLRSSLEYEIHTYHERSFIWRFAYSFISDLVEAIPDVESPLDSESEIATVNSVSGFQLDSAGLLLLKIVKPLMKFLDLEKQVMTPLSKSKSQ